VFFGSVFPTHNQDEKKEAWCHFSLMDVKPLSEKEIDDLKNR